ncbi:MAG: right-handed parallel beta-helix repeat-containing protein, partial [Clostridia bacterium]|nr:right-handed parallel beta-helix repeat-containing protein [Clostridia bacterium]
GVETDLADLKGSLLPAGATSDAIVLSGNTEDGIVNNIVYFDAVAKASSADELQAALNATGNVVVQLTNDIEGDVNIVSAADKKVIIDGGNNDFAGVITIDGKSATYTTAGFTIKNVNFVADSISADACIQLGDGTIATRYTCNVTVENCTFDVPGAVGVKSYTGGDKNLVIRDCTATANAHSLVQAKGIDGVLVENCKVYSKNGLNFNNSDNVTVVGCTVDVKGYAVRFGESSGGSGAAETYLIKDCSLTSANDDGDATIILRGTADNSTLTIENTTIFGTPDIANTAANATVIK